MQPVERRILVKVANMYYVENLKQSEIAERMGIDRTTVSKYLKKALRDKIVKITVESDSFDELEAALERRFGLKEACVVPKSYDMQFIKEQMARAGLRLIRRILGDGKVVGMAWGTTISELAKFAEQEKNSPLDIDFVPLDGGPESIESEFHVNTICYQMARAFSGRSHYIYAPAIAKTAAIRQAIVQDVNYEKISAYWDRLNIGIVGIGAPVKSSNLVWAGSFGREAIESLAQTGAVGEICSVFYDINGHEVTTPFSDRIIAVGLEKLRQLEYSIGLAASREKVPAIMGALRGRLINVLITDEETAKILLNE
ncbi:MAG: sugar-binding transcriptional regulator [Selenomonas sp.]|jgi:DNA-binding transcriptional regulator LsrR (DeoR family)|uniref:sugar-binding transcriptional regulator n=1 Tax=Selenomonas sp. AE3005 TaxID=1485543 RepID=UPI000488208A|nr:sugar-binding transcriptional regulator [Selenomonas sp. AE3005]MBQ2087693.1 sugar-binding transcriptional regulator [Selenomonas sp.]